MKDLFEGTETESDSLRQWRVMEATWKYEHQKARRKFLVKMVTKYKTAIAIANELGFSRKYIYQLFHETGLM